MADIKGILFDKDGTLVDFHATWFAVADKLAMEAAEGDRDKAEALLTQAGLDLASGNFKPDSVFAAGTNLDVVELWFPQLSSEARKERLAHFNRITVAEGAAMAVPLPGMAETLATLHAGEYRLGVATNDSTAGAEKTLTALGIAQLFEAAYGYDAVANPKPAPDTILAFCDLTGLTPSQIAMVGDNRHDLDMARAGGCGLAIGVLSGTGTRQSLAPLADVVLESIAELPAFLAQRP